MRTFHGTLVCASTSNCTKKSLPSTNKQLRVIPIRLLSYKQNSDPKDNSVYGKRHEANFSQPCQEKVNHSERTYKRNDCSNRSCHENFRCRMCLQARE